MPTLNQNLNQNLKQKLSRFLTVRTKSEDFEFVLIEAPNNRSLQNRALTISLNNGSPIPLPSAF